MELQKPTTQVEEVLYILIKNAYHHRQLPKQVRRGVSRRAFLINSGVLNSPACISMLRKKGFDITTKAETTTNKFGREINFSRYSLNQWEKAMIAYNDMINDK